MKNNEIDIYFVEAGLALLKYMKYKYSKNDESL